MKVTKILAVLLSFAALTFVSCGDDDDNDNDKDEEIEIDNGKGENANKELTPAEQKKYIESTGKEFLAHFDTSEFTNLADIIDYVGTHYTDNEDYDCDDVEDRFEDILSAIPSTKLGEHSESEKEEYYGSTYYYYYNYTTYKKIYRAANFTGHFNAGSKGWEYTKANDLQFTFKDGKGKQCKLTLTTSGENASVYMGEDEDWDYDYESDYSKGEYKYYYDIETNKVYVIIPKTINVTLTQGGAEIVKVTVQTDLSSLTNECFNLARSKMNVTTNVKLQNYDINLSKVAVNLNGTTSMSMEMKHNGKAILALSAEGSTKVSGQTEVNGDDMDDLEVNEAKNVSFSTNFLGKVQLKGKISDVRKMAQYLDEADENEEDETEFKKAVKNAEKLMDCGIYFDNGSKKQSTLGLEPTYENDHYYGRWYVEPVLKFSDGTSYSTLNSFFNERDFKSLIKAFEDLVENFEDEFEKYDR